MVYYIETDSVSMLDFALNKVGREDGWNVLVYVGHISHNQVVEMAGIRFMLIRSYDSRERAIRDNGPVEKCETIFITQGNGEHPRVLTCQRTIKGVAHEITVSLQYEENRSFDGVIQIDGDPSWRNQYFQGLNGFYTVLDFLEYVRSEPLSSLIDVRKLIRFVDSDAYGCYENWDVDKFLISKLLKN